MARRSKSKMRQMHLGQTIVAEREQAESESTRMLARRKAHRRRTTSILVVALMLAILVLAGYLGFKEWAAVPVIEAESEPVYQVKAPIIDEDNRDEVSRRVQNYVGQLEQNLQSRGLKLARATLPTGSSRALYIDIEGQEAYYKVDIDRGAGVTAEDIERMSRYLREHDLHPAYVDVRVAGKAYYK